MEILLYSAQDDVDEQRILEKIDALSLQIQRSPDRLRASLNIPSELRRIVILMIRKDDEIELISEWINLFFDILLVIVLRTDGPGTVKAAYKLRPRYVSFGGHQLQDVADVVKRMLEYYGHAES